MSMYYFTTKDVFGNYLTLGEARVVMCSATSLTVLSL